MPRPEDHLSQARRNLTFFDCVHSGVSDSYDWQVTICFYSAVHLVNFHLSRHGFQYRSHSNVNNAINPYGIRSSITLPENEYIAYEGLRSLSRRSRYLVREGDNSLISNEPAFTNDKHLSKALRHLNTLLKYFSEKYKLDFPTTKVKCAYLKGSNELIYFIKILK